MPKSDDFNKKPLQPVQDDSEADLNTTQLHISAKTQKKPATAPNIDASAQKSANENIGKTIASFFKIRQILV